MSAEDFWKRKFNEEFFETIFTKFINDNDLSQQKLFSTLAIIPENGDRFCYFASTPIPDFKRDNEEEYRLKSDFCRHVTSSEDKKSTLEEFLTDCGCNIKDNYSKDEVMAFFKSLCKYTFPRACFANPYKINNCSEGFSKPEIVFKEYTAPSDDVISSLNHDSAELSTLYTKYKEEHIVFPYRYVRSYYVPSFQPEAVIYFVANINEDELVCYNNYLQELLESKLFKDWEQSLSSEIALEKFYSFMDMVKNDLNKNEGKEFVNIIKDNLKYLIRGHETSELGSRSNKIMEIKVGYEVIKWGFDDKDTWTAPFKNKEGLIDHYNNLISGLVNTLYEMLDIRSKNAVLEKYKQMFELLQQPLNRLTDALVQTQVDTQELRAILYEPQKAIFSIRHRIDEFFQHNRVIYNPDGSVFYIKHSINNYKDENAKDGQWALSHILAAMRGAKPYSEAKSGETALRVELAFLNEAINDQAHTFHKFSKSLIELLGFSNEDINSICEEKNMRIALQNIKTRLVDPFKPGSCKNDLEWAVLKVLLPEKARKLANIGDSTVCIKGHSSLLVSQGVLIEFISSVVTALAQDNGKFNSISYLDEMLLFDIKSVKSMKSTSLEELKDSLTFFIAHREMLLNTSLDSFGDLTRPFLILAKRIPPHIVEVQNPNLDDMSFSWCVGEINFIMKWENGINQQNDKVIFSIHTPPCQNLIDLEI